MSFKTVVVVGGGPVGLLCAIDARNFFGTVVVVEKRSGYSRLNSPVLDQDIRNHFKTLGIHEDAGLGKNAQGAASFSRIEGALEKKACSVGVTMLRPYTVATAVGSGKAKGGRYKSAVLTIQEWDDYAKTPLTRGQSKTLAADLIVIASGGGASSDPLMQTLGFSWERLKAKNYGAYAALGDDKGMPDDNPDRMEGQKATKDIAESWIRFPTPDHQYLLATLSGITSQDFKALKGSTDKLRKVMDTIYRAADAGCIREIKEVANAVGIFKIAIQRAREMFSPDFPAVLVGDSAVTPHPEKGSGYTTGFRGFEELHTMFEALDKTHRSKDNSVIYQAFNDRYELHVSRKAIEGTSIVLKNNIQLLSNFARDVRLDMAPVKNQTARDIFKRYAKTAEKLTEDMKVQKARADDYYEYLKPDTGLVPPEFKWTDTVGSLWDSVNRTHAEIKRFTADMALLDERLEHAQSLLKIKA